MSFDLLIFDFSHHALPPPRSFSTIRPDGPAESAGGIRQACYAQPLSEGNSLRPIKRGSARAALSKLAMPAAPCAGTPSFLSSGPGKHP